MPFRPLLPILLLLSLAACGADGEPSPPPAAADQGLTITGDASIGIALQP